MLVCSNKKCNGQGDVSWYSIRELEDLSDASVGELHGPYVENAFGSHASGFVSRDGGEESAGTSLTTRLPLDVQGGRTSVALALDKLSKSSATLEQLPSPSYRKTP